MKTPAQRTREALDRALDRALDALPRDDAARAEAVARRERAEAGAVAALERVGLVRAIYTHLETALATPRPDWTRVKHLQAVWIVASAWERAHRETSA